jgi:hypothetical protein
MRPAPRIHIALLFHGLGWIPIERELQIVVPVEDQDIGVLLPVPEDPFSLEFDGFVGHKRARNPRRDHVRPIWAEQHPAPFRRHGLHIEPDARVPRIIRQVRVWIQNPVPVVFIKPEPAFDIPVRNIDHAMRPGEAVRGHKRRIFFGEPRLAAARDPDFLRSMILS